MSTCQAIATVWRRYFAIYKKNLWFGIVTTFVEPLLYLVSFGVGVGGLVGAVTTESIRITYRQFVFSGIVGQALLFQGFFEAAYGGFVRMYYQKVFQAIAVTPVTMSEVLWGELLWDASKATFSSSAVLLIGAICGDFSIAGSLLALPVIFICSLLFASLGLLTAARSSTIDEISYPQFLLIFPMFLFCGVFFPLDQMPAVIQGIAWLLPLTPVISVIRSLTLGFPLKPLAALAVIAWTVILVRVARRAMRDRLVK
ncbi:MAG TPA: ABC transporter permease [Candidatus Ozemobacteraceae bacterium]|nr:ABC transporter permease [Candidatus Ozemobacteraceae bacterium]